MRAHAGTNAGNTSDRRLLRTRPMSSQSRWQDDSVEPFQLEQPEQRRVFPVQHLDTGDAPDLTSSNSDLHRPAHWQRALVRNSRRQQHMGRVPRPMDGIPDSLRERRVLQVPEQRVRPVTTVAT